MGILLKVSTSIGFLHVDLSGLCESEETNSIPKKSHALLSWYFDNFRKFHIIWLISDWSGCTKLPIHIIFWLLQEAHVKLSPYEASSIQRALWNQRENRWVIVLTVCGLEGWVLEQGPLCSTKNPLSWVIQFQQIWSANIDIYSPTTMQGVLFALLSLSCTQILSDLRVCIQQAYLCVLGSERADVSLHTNH